MFWFHFHCHAISLYLKKNEQSRFYKKISLFKVVSGVSRLKQSSVKSGDRKHSRHHSIIILPKWDFLVWLDFKSDTIRCCLSYSTMDRYFLIMLICSYLKFSDSHRKAQAVSSKLIRIYCQLLVQTLPIKSDWKIVGKFTILLDHASVHCS